MIWIYSDFGLLILKYWRLYSVVKCQFKAIDISFDNAQQIDVNLKNIKQNIEGLFLMHYKDIRNAL